MTRARDLGIPFDGQPGPWNAITDVAGVEVGYVTLIHDFGPARTGVTAILPRGQASADPVFAGWFPLNGNGEMTGTTWIEESGFLEGPILLTNTHSVGVVRDAVVAWQVKHGKLFQPYSYPLVAETYDGYLNDINGFHIKAEHAHTALDSARSGPIAEGNVGGGTGMICYDFKGGTGTASRHLPDNAGGYTVGVLVQANFGARHQLTIAGVPVGKELAAQAPISTGADHNNDRGSIIIVVATNAPLLPHQLKRVARRAGLGLARTGSIAANSSGDIFIAFSTANPEVARSPSGLSHAAFIPNDDLTPLFEAAILAAEEAILNALMAAQTMTGLAGHTVQALPHADVQTALRKYNRLA